MIGGAFWILNSSKAINVGILSFIRFSGRLERYRWIRFLGVNNIIITLVMILFSVFGAVFGMSEETIAFIIIMVPLAITMGYDSIVGVSLCFVAAALGFAGAVLIYANRIKKDPSRSPVYQEDEYWREKGKADIRDIQYNTPVSAWVVYGIILAGLILFSVFNPLTTMTFGDPQSGTGSSFTSPLIPVITGLFLEGVKDILSAAFVVGLAGGIIVILEDGRIVGSILHGLSSGMKGVGETASIGIM